MSIDSEPEADPNGDEWDDLNTEDDDDPLLVSEYVTRIFDYMKNVEVSASRVYYPRPSDPSPSNSSRLPNPDYMLSQKELVWSMRGIPPGRLVQVHAARFLLAWVVSLAKLQLVGITCLFISSKVEEIVALSVSHFFSLRQFLMQRVRNPPRRALRTEDGDRLELVNPKPNALPPSYQHRQRTLK